MVTNIKCQIIENWTLVWTKFKFEKTENHNYSKYGKFWVFISWKKLKLKSAKSWKTVNGSGVVRRIFTWSTFSEKTKKFSRWNCQNFSGGGIGEWSRSTIVTWSIAIAWDERKWWNGISDCENTSRLRNLKWKLTKLLARKF